MSFPKNTVHHNAGPRNEEGLSEEWLQLEKKLGGRASTSFASPVEELRSGLRARSTIRDQLALTKELSEGVTTKDLTVPADDGYQIHIRVYSTASGSSSSPKPAAVYFHGGGWMIGSVQDDDLFARKLALELDHIVVSVDYRLAPEYVYPVAGNDSYTVFLWVLDNAASLGVDADRIYVTGNSAGGHMATVTALKVAQSDKPTALAGQILRIPCTCHPEAVPGPAAPKRDNVPILNDSGYFDAFNQYAKVCVAKNTDVSPLLADPELLKKLPPTYIDVCTEDPLFDGGVAYAKKLDDLGVPVKLFVITGMPHGSFILFPELPSSVAANTSMLDGVKWVLSLRK